MRRSCVPADGVHGEGAHVDPEFAQIDRIAIMVAVGVDHRMNRHDIGEPQARRQECAAQSQILMILESKRKSPRPLFVAGVAAACTHRTSIRPAPSRRSSAKAKAPCRYASTKATPPRPRTSTPSRRDAAGARAEALEIASAGSVRRAVFPSRGGRLAPTPQRYLAISGFQMTMR